MTEESATQSRQSASAVERPAQGWPKACERPSRGGFGRGLRSLSRDVPPDGRAHRREIWDGIAQRPGMRPGWELQRPP